MQAKDVGDVGVGFDVTGKGEIAFGINNDCIWAESAGGRFADTGDFPVADCDRALRLDLGRKNIYQVGIDNRQIGRLSAQGGSDQFFGYLRIVHSCSLLYRLSEVRSTTEKVGPQPLIDFLC
ncbi:MAG: hypothetical protein KAI69_06930 [Deltaproteobacteria bacterium]|nr:hypothetical protein [Deltaproteobacteria bacterium]